MTYDILSEQETIAIFIANNESFNIAVEKYGITEDTFTDNECKNIFTQIDALIKSNTTADLFLIDMPFVVKNYLIKRCSEVMFEYTDTEINNLFEKIKRLEILRNTKEKVEEIKECLESKTETASIEHVSGMLDEAKDTMANYFSGSHVDTMESIVPKVDLYVSQEKGILSLFGRGTKPDKAFYLHSGETMVLCGNTGTGKTALAVEFALNIAYSGKRVLYVCTESSDVDIFLRMASLICSVPHWECREPTRRGALLRATYMGMSKVINKNMFFHCLSRHKPNVESIERVLHGIEKEYGNVDAMFIDYIQDLGYPKSMARLQERERVEIITDKLHDLCISHGIAGIYLSQLNRTGDKDTPPGNEQIKSAGKIAEKAHIVSFIWRKRTVITADEAEKSENKDNSINSQIGYGQKTEKGNDDVTLFYSTKCRNTKPFNMRLKFEDNLYILEGDSLDNYPIFNLLYDSVPGLRNNQEDFSGDKYYNQREDSYYNGGINNTTTTNPADEQFTPYSGYSYLAKGN